jgi:dTDP-4-amino-4,6-dideoxygalactose transaminase
VTRESPARQEIILPAYTCPALVKVILDVGLQPHLVDISAHTFAFEADPLAAAFGERTLAVIVVHPFGLPQDISEVVQLARSNGVVVIEDAAQAMGARWQGQLVGTRADFGLFSLGPGKSLSVGGGGFISIRDPHGPPARLLNQTEAALPPSSRLGSVRGMLRLCLYKLAFHPWGWGLVTRANLHRIGEQEASWGYHLSSLTAAQANLGAEMLPRLAGFNEQRRQNAQQLIAQLQHFDFVHLLPVPAESEPIYLRLPLLINDKTRRERLFNRLWTAGIGVGRLYGRPLSEFFPALAHSEFPGATHIAAHLLTLPTHHYLTETDIARIAEIFHAEK